MKLPNVKQAVLALEKLTDYCLNKHHEGGKDKAIAFERALGIRIEQAAVLREMVLEAVQEAEAIDKGITPYGHRYQVDMVLHWQGKKAKVRTGWIVLVGKDYPQLTTIFIDKE
jgi:hypothetical protein